MEDVKSSRGWTDRELLSSLLYLVQKNNVTFDWSEGLYPAGRNASGFKQKINILKRTLKPEWDAMASGASVPQGTPKKAPATPRKRKPEADQDSSGKAESAKKSRASSNKKITASGSDDDDDEVGLGVKAEPKEEQFDDIGGQMYASWEI